MCSVTISSNRLAVGNSVVCEPNDLQPNSLVQENAPLVNRGLKPKPVASGAGAVVGASASEHSSAFSTLKSTSARRNANGPGTPGLTPLMQHQHTVKPTLTSPPPNIDRKLKPPPSTVADAPAAPAAAVVAVTPSASAATAATSYASQTLPRNYNHTAARHAFGHMRSNSTVLSLSTAATATTAIAPSSVLQPMLDYLELDTSAGGAPAGAATGGGAVAVLATTMAGRAKVGSTASATVAAAAAAAAAAEESSIVYKSVDFIKTEAIKRTRQDRTKTSNGGD